MEVSKPGSHVDHLLRQTRTHHMELSSMADLKANMLLTMASVVITLSVPHLIKPHLKWAVLVLIASCLVTIILAAFATMPKLPILLKSGSPPDITSPKFNLLFFGDFTRLSYEQFEAAMEDIMNDPSRTYQAQVRELYTLGLFLAKKKFRFVKLAYIAFIGGLFASGLVVLWVELLG